MDSTPPSRTDPTRTPRESHRVQVCAASWRGGRGGGLAWDCGGGGWRGGGLRLGTACGADAGACAAEVLVDVREGGAAEGHDLVVAVAADLEREVPTLAVGQRGELAEGFARGEGVVERLAGHLRALV